MHHRTIPNETLKAAEQAGIHKQRGWLGRLLFGSGPDWYVGAHDAKPQIPTEQFWADFEAKAEVEQYQQVAALIVQAGLNPRDDVLLKCLMQLDRAEETLWLNEFENQPRALQ